MKRPPSQPTVIVQWEPLLSNINLNPDEMQAHKAAPPNTPIIRSTVVRCLKYVCKWTTEKKTGESNLINLVDVRMWHCYALLDFIVPAFEKSQSCFPCFFQQLPLKKGQLPWLAITILVASCKSGIVHIQAEACINTSLAWHTVDIQKHDPAGDTIGFPHPLLVAEFPVNLPRKPMPFTGLIISQMHWRVCSQRSEGTICLIFHLANARCAWLVSSSTMPSRKLQRFRPRRNHHEVQATNL